MGPEGGCLITSRADRLFTHIATTVMSSRIIVQLESQRHQRPPPPGDESYGPTVNMFSFTSAILRQNVPSIWLDAHKRFAIHCCSPWFGFSLVLGTRREHLQVQGVAKIRYPGDKHAMKRLCEELKGLLHVVPHDGLLDVA